MTATFAGNPATTIIVAYSPTNTTVNDEEVEAFYEDLRKTIDEICEIYVKPENKQKRAIVT